MGKKKDYVESERFDPEKILESKFFLPVFGIGKILPVFGITGTCAGVYSARVEGRHELV